MYIIASTYGGIDWGDSHTICQQVKNNGSFNIEESEIPAVIANDVIQYFPQENNLKENILDAFSRKAQYRFTPGVEKKDDAGAVSYKECGTYEEGGETFYENEVVYDGKKQTLTQSYYYGQISYITTYHVMDIPDDQLGYMVTEDFLVPFKGIPLIERMYHDIFYDLSEAQDYAANLKLHDFEYPKSIAVFQICDRGKAVREKWYQLEREAMDLMKEKGQTHLCDSFDIFPQKHIENLKRL